MNQKYYGKNLEKKELETWHMPVVPDIWDGIQVQGLDNLVRYCFKIKK